MYTDDPHIKAVIVDDQTVYIPDAEGWDGLLQAQEFAGTRFALQDWREWWQRNLDFIRRYPEFTLALYAPGSPPAPWLITLLLQTGSGWQRVHVEYLLCEVCGWYGATANPMVSDLYTGTPDKWAAMRAAEKHPVLPCPNCDSQLPRHSIWVEPPIQTT